MIQKLVTTGVYGLSEPEFFARLQDEHVDTFCDVRLRRGMRGSRYAFANSSRLQQRLQELGVRYLHQKQFAPPKEVRQIQKQADQASATLKQERLGLGPAFIQAYRDACLKTENRDLFMRSLPQEARIVALFCVERPASACHRSVLAEWLSEGLGVEVKHLP